MTPDFVVAGHVVRDVVPGGWEMGGTVTFAAAQAHRLGLRPGVITRTAGDVDFAARMPFADVVDAGSSVTTSFENVYYDGHRKQKVRAQGEPLRASDVPEDWRSAPIVLVGPVFAEAPADFPGVFTGPLVGVSAQGWLRELDADGSVRTTPWRGAPFWRAARVLFVSDEDLGGESEQLEVWASEVPVVVMTRARLGARICESGKWREIEAFPAREVDPTGAGDTFATAFLIRLHESGDVGEAARFGAAAASLSVSGAGVASIPARAEIDRQLQEHPGIRLR